jgi:hypothetical protein
MARQSIISDQGILEAALAGLETQRNRIDEAMRQIRSQLGIRGVNRPTISTDGTQQAPPRRTMSAVARRRIGLAQKKRWAARAERTEVPKSPEKPKRKISAAGKKRIAEATRKRWAAYRRAKAQKVSAKPTVVKKAAAKKATAKPKARKAPAKSTVPTTAVEATA